MGERRSKIGGEEARRADALARAAALLVLALAGCVTPRPRAVPVDQPGAPRIASEATSPAGDPRADRVVANDAIVVAGDRFSIGTRVVLWDEPPYFDATVRAPRFDADAAAGDKPRFRPGRDGIAGHPDPASLRAAVDQFVLHFDVCGSSERCFRVLHDLRGLSVHFLLDVDGTIYQTLDVREQAWHATKANARSVGVEIANIGAYPIGDAQPLWDWYGVEPGSAVALGERTAGQPVAFVEGEVQGARLVQAEFTPAQEDALVKLAAGLSRALPCIRVDAPRGPDGRVKDAALSSAEFDAFQGILGHFHVQTNKVDPGPAFPWDEFLERVRVERAAQIDAQVDAGGIEAGASAR